MIYTIGEATVLKPCPFCGNKEPDVGSYALDDPAYASAAISCKKCGARSSKHHRSLEEAITWWNSRSEV